MNSEKVLHILGDSKFGGDSVLVLALGLAAQQQGYEVDVLATHSVFQEAIRRQGLGVVDLDVIRRQVRPVWDMRGILRLTRFLKKAEYSLVHTHTSKAGVAGRLAARRARVPAIVHTVHGFAFHEQSGRLHSALYQGAERLAARWCDKIVTVSSFHRSWALRAKIGSPGQVIDIPNGLPPGRVEASRSRDEVRAELGVTDQFVIISTGRLAQQKGLEYLVRAIPLVTDTLPITVLLAGDGELRSDLQYLVSDLGLDERVRFLGFREDIGDLLAAADVVVLPSLWEGLSISLLEAMAAGKPTITTSIGSNIEVTNNGEAAYLVPSQDSTALANALRTLANDTQMREALGVRAQQRQMEHYTMDRMSSSYLDLYKSLLSQSNDLPL